MNTKLRNKVQAENNSKEKLEITQEYHGPIPHPNIIKQFEEILPGSADRILKLSENEQKHRQNLEKKAVDHQIRIETLGLLFGFILALIIIAGGVYLLINDKSARGFSLIIGGIAAIITPFIFSKKQK